MHKNKQKMCVCDTKVKGGDVMQKVGRYQQILFSFVLDFVYENSV